MKHFLFANLEDLQAVRLRNGFFSEQLTFGGIAPEATRNRNKRRARAAHSCRSHQTRRWVSRRWDSICKCRVGSCQATFPFERTTLRSARDDSRKSTELSGSRNLSRTKRKLQSWRRNREDLQLLKIATVIRRRCVKIPGKFMSFTWSNLSV